MKEEIKFNSRVLVSTKTGDVAYHDDMNGENVWFNVDRPRFIHSYDWREFNGIPISEIAAILEKWDNKHSRVDIEGMKDLQDLRFKYKKP